MPAHLFVDISPHGFGQRDAVTIDHEATRDAYRRDHEDFPGRVAREAASSGLPVLYVRRDDWPEQEFLIEWLAANGVCAEIGRSDLASGAWVDAMGGLLEGPRQSPDLPAGAMEAALLVAEYLER